MFNFKRILVGVDGSESSLNAIRQALALAKDSGAEMRGISVYMDLENAEVLYASTEKMRMDAMAPATRAIEQALAISKETGVKMDSDVLPGDPYEVISEEATRWGADVVILGRRGLSRLDRMLLGSTSQRTIAHCPVPLVIFPRDSKLGSDVALAATDGSELALAAVDAAADFSAAHKGRLVLLSVIESNDEFSALAPDIVEKIQTKALSDIEELKKRAESKGCSATALVREGRPFEVISSVAADEKAGIIFMGSHGRKGLKRWMMGSVAEKVIGHATCPVFIYKK